MIFVWLDQSDHQVLTYVKYIGLCVSTDWGSECQGFGFRAPPILLILQCRYKKKINIGPWTFNNHLLIVYCLQDGENPLMVDINDCHLWIKVHALLAGCMWETMTKFGSFLSKYIYYDSK